jgi:hypothetical protein
LVSGSLKSEEANLLGRLTLLVEAAKLPAEQQDARFRQIQPPLRMQVLVWTFFPAISNVAAAYRLEQAQVRCMLTALAVERYRHELGHWLASLAALVPRQMSQVPLDPYDGRPLRYGPLADGVVIYSVGPDLTDNAGKLDRKNPGATGANVGIRLWDVPKRRQLPPEP